MAGAVFTQTLGGYADPWEEVLAAKRKALEQPQAPMYSPAQVAERRAQNEREYQLGILGQLSGDEQLGGVGGQVLKQALAGRTPRVSERGAADPISGQFTYNPEYLRERGEAEIAGLETKQAAGRQAYAEARTRAQERAEEGRQRAADRAALVAAGGGAGGGGHFAQAGFTPDGQQVVTHSKTGMNYVLTVGPNGAPAYAPFAGTVTPKGTFEKQTVDAQENLASADRASALIGAVKADPDAFGARAAGVGMLPGAMQGWVAPAMGLSKDQMQLRAQVGRDAAYELNRIYGAAQSAGELRRAAAWAPNASDDFDTVMNKLQAAHDWATQNAQQYGAGVSGAARTRSGGGGASGSWEQPQQFEGFTIRKKAGGGT